MNKVEAAFLGFWIGLIIAVFTMLATLSLFGDLKTECDQHIVNMAQARHAGEEIEPVDWAELLVCLEGRDI